MKNAMLFLIKFPTANDVNSKAIKVKHLMKLFLLIMVMEVVKIFAPNSLREKLFNPICENEDSEKSGEKSK